MIALCAMLVFDSMRHANTRGALYSLQAEVHARLQVPYDTYYESHGRVPKIEDLPAFHNPRVRAVDIDANGSLVIRMSVSEGVLRLAPVFGAKGVGTWTCRSWTTAL